MPFVEKRFLSLDNTKVNQLFELLEIDDVSLADIIIYKKTDALNSKKYLKKYLNFKNLANLWTIRIHKD